MRKEVAEIREICEYLNSRNRQYVLAVANALKFSQDNGQKIHERPQKKQ